MTKNYKIIIPARYQSSRFPGKPLAQIFGKEMIIRVAEICSKVDGKKNVIIATDDKRIFQVCKKNGFVALMTPKNCATGTDRLYHASKKLKTDIIINVQGDEPLISSKDIKKIINAKKKFKNHVICGYSKITLKEALSINTPKVIVNDSSELIYISRSLIPGIKDRSNMKNVQYFRQVCIYAFNYSELKKFYWKKRGKIEKSEDIEIIRFFDLNIPVKMIKLNGQSKAVDTKEDLKIVKRYFNK